MCPAEVAEQILHVVTHLVSNHVCVGKVAVSPEGLLHGGEEREVDIDTLVCRAVERTYAGGCATATRLHGAVEENKCGSLVGLAEFLELCRPHVLGGGKHLLGKVLQFLLLSG